MKIVHTEILIERGDVPLSRQYRAVLADVKAAIASVTWPPDSKRFTLNNQERQSNGIKPIKKQCMETLERRGWECEQRLVLTRTSRPGNVDAVKRLKDGRLFAIEWETGNISSSHRALNKMAVGMIDGIIAGGVLIVPSRAMYQWLTDRIGNYDELVPYFPVWKGICSVVDGVLSIVVVEHDALSHDVTRIPKGTDGRANR